MLKVIIFLLVSITFSFGKDVYISSSTGDDANDGSINAPLKTISSAPKNDVNIFLKRGDVFFEKCWNFTNCKIDAYGKGDKPMICGLKILKNKSVWVRQANDIWRIDLKNRKDFEGFVSTTDKEDNIGAIYDITNDKVYGHLVHRYSAINNYGDFWVSDNIKRKNVQSKKETFKYLFFRSKENPAKMNSQFGFSTYNCGLRNLKNCTVKNIAIKGFALHGIAKAWNCKFQNIDIDLIGGGVQLSYPSWVRLGNGIEFWITEKDACNNNIVENCKISRTYDCGTTIQGVSNGDVIAKNIVFKNNYFFKCRQAFEHFLISKTKEKIGYENCEFSNNKCFDIGDNEFSTPECRDANLLSYETRAISGLSIKNNIFWGGNYYSKQQHPATLENNTVYIFKGQYLINNRYNPSETIWADSEQDIEKMKEQYGNKSDKIIIVSPSDIHMREKILRESFAEQKSEIQKKSPVKYRRDFFFRK